MPSSKSKKSEAAPDSILLRPKTSKQLAVLERINTCDKFVSKAAPGVLVKWGGDHQEEVRALKFLSGKLSVHTPRVLLHPPFPRAPVNPLDYGRCGVWYFYMEECPGVPLDGVIETKTPAELDHIADQLSTVLIEMRSYKSRTLGSVSGGPYNNRFMPYPWTPKHAFDSVGEYSDHYREMFLEFCGAEYVDELFNALPRNAPVNLTHGDLLPRNILVDGSTITAIIDWETAGFYPEYWEYCRMHYPGWMTPGWDYVLRRVFPGLRREKEIKTVTRIVNLLHHNCAF